MKILLWTGYYVPEVGGLEVMVHSLAKALIELGHEIKVIANTSRMHPRLGVKQVDGVEVNFFHMQKSLLHRDIRSSCEQIRQLQSLVKAYQPDVIHFHVTGEIHAFYQVRVLNLTSTKYLFTCHGVIDVENYLGANLRKLVEEVDQVTLVSHYLCAQWRAYQLTQKNPPLTIHNGLAFPDDVIQEENSASLVMLVAGRIEKEKRFHLAIWALSRLIVTYPKLSLHILGQGSEESNLLELAKQLGVSHAAHFKGAVEMQARLRYFDEANLVLVSSEYESFCLVALEAAMRARPVVASLAGGLSEVIEDGVTGFLVDPNDFMAYVRAIDCLLSDKNRRKKMGLAAYARAKSCFSINKVSREYVSVYQQLLGMDKHQVENYVID